MPPSAGSRLLGLALLDEAVLLELVVERRRLDAEQALVFAEKAELDESDLPASLHGPGARAAVSAGNIPVPHGDRPLPDILEDIERQLIQRAYEKANGVKTETARLLGIKTSALYYKLEKYGFIQKGERPGEEPAS